MLHQNPRSALSLSDEYETPHDVFNSICEKYEIIPIVDVCATVENKKCSEFFDVNSEYQYTCCLLVLVLKYLSLLSQYTLSYPTLQLHS